MFVPGVNGSVIANSNAPSGSRLKGAYNNFKNSKKRKMPNGGFELALDAASFAPPPVGTAASLLGAGLNAYQGDYTGMSLDLASAASGGASKWFGAAADLAKAAGSAKVASKMASKTKAFQVLSNPVISKTASTARDFSSAMQNSPYNATMRVPQRDNAQVKPFIKPKMPNGGVVFGDYDKSSAPKKGSYLLPDINRPSYIDESGGRRSEYKMGVNIDGKETLIPTVVNGKQLTEDQAIDRYRQTGLHMGKFNTPQEAEYASRLRTARYNMLEDPIRFQADQFQRGGTLPPIYTSNPRDPRIRRYNDSLNLYNKEKRIYENETGLSYNRLLAYAPSNSGPPRYGYTFSGKPLYGYKKPVQRYIYKKPEPVATPVEPVITPVEPIIPLEQPVKQIGYNRPVIQQFNYMSPENKAKALQKYGSVSDIPFKGVDINQLKNGGKVEDHDDDKEMVDGVASILRGVKSKSNRLQLANKMAKQFNREKVNYNLKSFLKKSKVKK